MLTRQAYLNELFDSLTGYQRLRIPSRLVRYGIIYGGSAKDALAEFEPQFDRRMKAQAEAMVEKLQAFIECCEAYEEATIEGPTEEDDKKAEAKEQV